MAKVSVQNIDNLQNEPSAVGRINSNFQALQAVIDTLLSRDGAAPNQMLSLLDMNNKRVINLPTPQHYTDAARHGDLQKYVDDADDAAERAKVSAEHALQSEINAANSAQEAEESLNEFESKYLGSLPEDPLLDANGLPVQPGALYFNTTVNQWRVYTQDYILVFGDFVQVNAEYVVVEYWTEMPQVTLRSLSDVSLDAIVNGQLVSWNAGIGQFVPFTLDATSVPYTGSLSAGTVYGALEEIVSRTLFDRYDFSVWIKNLLVANDVLFKLQPTRTFTLPAVTTEFKASAVIPSNGTQVLSMRKNGTQFGTVTFSAGNPTGVWSIPGDTVFTPIDTFTIQTGASVDTLLRGINLTFAGRR